MTLHSCSGRQFPSSRGFGNSPPAGTGFSWRWRRGGRTAGATAAARPDLQGSPKLARLEAALFVASQALPPRKLAQLAMLADARETHELILRLNARYDASGSAFRVEQFAGGYQLLTRPHLAPWLDRIHHRQSQLKLSPSMLETLAIIAYRQPCTRADVEAIRGVQASEMIKQLMEKSLVRITGEDQSLGRPFLYGTTRQFLELFGLSGVEDLPMAERLMRKAA